MAARLICSRHRMVAYLPNFRAAVRHLRAFSSYDENQPNVQYYDANGKPIEGTIWPDKHLGPFGPSDKRFPMPGLVGTTVTEKTESSIKAKDPDTVHTILPDNHKNQTVQDFLDMAEEVAEEGFISEPQPSALDTLECVAQDCPDLIKKDFMDLFPGQDVCSGPFTVITISQKTKNDMTSWSEDVEEERESLLENFIIGAKEICESLQAAGYWADFVDPSSGRPYLGPYTNATLYETDERYRHFGFKINDLGCCKVISHHLWGVHSYIGCLFTNAPYDHPILDSMKDFSDDETV
ncbi:unnamed protein product [Owenia fusiformis]|uniref:Uncharacterized protein n=1 Tax=Owenia fusiformis TaxID=6347 RepID=A0A8S4P9Y4_OWEFU|nr:unnamed protein product [Owenia fusiformis]